MIQWYVQKMGYELSTLARLSPKEFRTIERPRVKELIHYLRMATHYSVPWDIRIGNLISVIRHYTVENARRSRRVLPTEQLPKQAVTPAAMATRAAA